MCRGRVEGPSLSHSAYWNTDNFSEKLIHIPNKLRQNVSSCPLFLITSLCLSALRSPLNSFGSFSLGGEGEGEKSFLTVYSKPAYLWTTNIFSLKAVSNECQLHRNGAWRREMWFWIVNLAAAFSITKFPIISFLCCFVSNKKKMPCNIQRAYRREDGQRQSRDAVASPQCALLLLTLLQVPILWTHWPDFKMGANSLWCVGITEVRWLLVALRSASSTCSLLLFPWELCVTMGRGSMGAQQLLETRYHHPLRKVWVVGLSHIPTKTANSCWTLRLLPWEKLWVTKESQGRG